MATMTIADLLTTDRDEAGALTIVSAGTFTVTIEPMTPADLEPWQWYTDMLTYDHPAGLRRLPARGWTITHTAAGTLGMLLQTHQSRIHVDRFDAEQDDYFFVGTVIRPRHGVVQLLHAHRRYGRAVPADPAPVVPAPAPNPLPAGACVRYHGSIADLHGQVFQAYGCDCDDGCEGLRYELHSAGHRAPRLLHVRRSSLTEAA